MSKTLMSGPISPGALWEEEAAPSFKPGLQLVSVTVSEPTSSAVVDAAEGGSALSRWLDSVSSAGPFSLEFPGCPDSVHTA